MDTPLDRAKARPRQLRFEIGRCRQAHEDLMISAAARVEPRRRRRRKPWPVAAKRGKARSLRRAEPVGNVVALDAMFWAWSNERKNRQTAICHLASLSAMCD
jgi:hypothetical protein